MVSILGTMVGCGKTESQLSELTNTKTAEQLQQEAETSQQEAETPQQEQEEEAESGDDGTDTGESSEAKEESEEGTDTSKDKSKGTSDKKEDTEEEDNSIDLDALDEFDSLDSGGTSDKDSTELAARRAVENGTECGLPELKVILPKYLVDKVSTTTILNLMKNQAPYQGTFVAYGGKKCSPIKMVALMKYSDTALRSAGYIGTSTSVYDNYSTVSSPDEKANIGMQRVNFMDTVDFEKPSLMTSAGTKWLNKAYKSSKKWKKKMNGTLYSMTKSDTTYDILFLYASKNEDDAKAQMELIMDSIYFIE